MSSAKGSFEALPRAMPVSRILRFLLGAAMVAWLTPPILEASWKGRGRVALVFLGLTGLYAFLHYVVGRYFGGLNRWLGALLAVGPVLGVAVLGDAFTVSAILYIGISLLIIALLGDPGCEVLAIPRLIMGRRTHLACLLFSPLDWVEERIVGLFSSAPKGS